MHAVYTAGDLGAFNQPAPLVVPHPNLTHGRTQRPLAQDKVCYIGEAVAMVVADDRYIAEDAVGLIEVDWEPLPAVVDFRRAAQSGQPLVHDDVPDNTAARLVQVVGDPEAAFEQAAHVFTEDLFIERSCGSPIEARGVVAVYEPRLGTLTVWDATQAPLTIKNGLANMLGLPEFKVEVIAPDVGGGFGTKIMMFFAEEVLVPWAAMRLRRPVKWTEDRREHFISANQERGQLHSARWPSTRTVASWRSRTCSSTTRAHTPRTAWWCRSSPPPSCQARTGCPTTGPSSRSSTPTRRASARTAGRVGRTRAS